METVTDFTFLGSKITVDGGDCSHEIKRCLLLDVPGGLDGKTSVYNVGDLGSIPGSGSSLEKEMATHSSILAWRIPMDRGAWQARVHGVAKSWT